MIVTQVDSCARASHRLACDLEADIPASIAISDDKPRPLVWTNTADEILGKLLARCDGKIGDGSVVLMNALSQTCTIEEPPWILYRPNNHATDQSSKLDRAVQVVRCRRSVCVFHCGGLPALTDC